MKKIVKESLYETIRTDSFSEGNSIGEQKCLKLIKQYMPFLKNVQWDDLDDRGISINNQDIKYSKWDQLSVITGDKCIDESPLPLLSLYLIQDINSDQIYAKFYYDTINYNGYGALNDEYMNELDPIPIENWDEERYKSVLKDIKKNLGCVNE